MKFLLIPTYSETVITFRRGLIEALTQRGHEVIVLAYDNIFEQEILALGVTFYCIKQNNRSLNPFTSLQYCNQTRQIIKKEKPDAVFTFQLKPNTFGIFAAKAAGMKHIFAMVEGAGDVFIHRSLKWNMIRFLACQLYKNAFKHAQKVFFLNHDDQAEFVSRKLVLEEKSQVLPGVGVDLEHFDYQPLKNSKNFLMVARMIRTKGVLEYCKCARLVKQQYPDAQFDYLGHESELTVADIRAYIDDGSVNYLGTTIDIRPFLNDTTALLLPSYREGMPMSIMEAEATGRAIITSDGIGCRETVMDKHNGFIVSIGDYETMAAKCIYMIEHPEEVVRMGKNSRLLAEERFDQRKINRQLAEILEGVHCLDENTTFAQQ